MKTLFFITLAVAVLVTGCLQPKAKKIPLNPRDGIPQAPVDVPPPLIPQDPQKISLAILEDSILLDLNTLSDVQQKETRYLNACGEYNQNLRDMGDREKATLKLMNSISPLARVGAIFPVAPVSCVFRFDKRDFDLTQDEWEYVEDYLLLQFIPQSQRGSQIQFLTQTLKPYVTLSDFAVTVLGADALTHTNGLYYRLINQPTDFAEFYRSIGADLQQQANDEELIVAARSQSQIALQKTRGMVLAETDDGFISISYDSALADQESHFEDPFPFEVAVAGGVLRSDKIYEEKAQEAIYTLKNGFTAYRLNGARDEVNGIGGEAETFAPGDVVFNAQAAARQLDPVIYIGSCHACHAAPLIPFQDQLRGHIERTAVFDALEKNLASVYFNNTKLQAAENNINQIHQSIANRVGLDNFNVDLIHEKLIFPLRAEQNADQVCGHLMLDKEVCLARIAGSLVSSQQFGNLLNGGTVSLAVLSNGFAQLVEDTAAYDDD